MVAAPRVVSVGCLGAADGRRAKEDAVSAGRIVGIVIGSLMLLVGLGLILGGGGVLVAKHVLADEQGFVSMRSAPIDQDAYAIVIPAQIDGPPWFWGRHAVMVRLDVTGRGANERPIFVGLADRIDADRYLAGVSVANVRDLRFAAGNPMRRPQLVADVVPGTTVPPAPATQSFWIATGTGTKTQSIVWRIEPGDYSVIVMNADASRGIAVTASIGAKAPIVTLVAAAVLGLGVIVFALGLLVVILSARRSGRGPQTDSAAAAGTPNSSGSAPGFPLSFQAEYSESVSPALWLVKWFLLIPHYIVLGFLWVGFACSWGISLIAILLTGRYPKGLFEYNVGVLRWTWRVGFYGYQALGTDRYPPFTLRAGGYPADLDVSYPGKLSRRLALEKWWLLAIPHYLIVGILLGGIGPHVGGLVLLLTVFAGVILLFTSRYPRDLFQIIVGGNRWAFRVLAYVGLMTDEYPPFRFDS